MTPEGNPIPNRSETVPSGQGRPISHGDDAGIQSTTTTGGDRSDERPLSPSEGPMTDAERLQAEED